MDVNRVADLAEVADELERRLTTTVWCTMATTDTAGRPRTRVVHPVWERSGPSDGAGLVGWLGVRTGTLKLRHLARTPWVSILYWDPRHEQVTIEARATVHHDDAARRRAWSLMASYPEPYGFDPEPIWPGGPTGEGFTAVRLDPVRVSLFGAPPTVWERPAGG